MTANAKHILILASFLAIFIMPKIASAQLVELKGWAWSSNIGWISFNCDQEEVNYCNSVNHKVSVDINSGEIIGKALTNRYSNYIPNSPVISNSGFIRFNPPTSSLNLPVYSDNTQGPATIELIDPQTIGQASGWAIFCSVLSDPVTCNGSYIDNEFRGDWDGWISLKGASHGVTVDVFTGQFNGYAWGGDYIGWIDFSGVYAVSPLVLDLSISASPETTNYQLDYKTTLTWRSIYTDWYECEAETLPSTSGVFGTTSWGGNPEAPSAGETLTQTVVVPNPETTFRIRCRTSPSADWSEWREDTVTVSDLWINTDSCFDSSLGLSVQYGSYNPDSSFDSCTASNSRGFSSFQGSVPPPPPGDFNEIQITEINENNFNNGIYFNLSCVDSNGITHPDPGQFPNGLSDGVTDMCSVTPPVPPAQIEISANECLPIEYWDENIGFPNTPVPVDFTITNTSNIDVIQCIGESDPTTSNLNGMIFPPVEAGTSVTQPGVEIVEYGQTSGLGSCNDTYGNTIDGIQPSVFNKGICGYSPTPDLKGVIPPSTDELDDIGIDEAVEPGTSINLTWNISYWLGATCALTSIVGDNSLTDTVVTIDEAQIPSGTYPNVTINGTSFLSLYCYIPAAPAKNGKDILRVCVQGGTCPTDPIGENTLPFFEEV